MKVLQFITRLDLGGAQEACLQQCRALLDQGHEVHLLTAPGGELLGDAQRMPGLHLRVWGDWRHAPRPVADARCLLRLARVIRRERFDVLHTHCSKAGIVGRYAALLARAPRHVFHHIHGWSFHEGQSALVRGVFVGLERIAARPGFLLLACSRATDASGRAHGIGRDEDRRVVQCGIDRRPCLKRRDRASIRRRLGLSRSDVLFLQLGNLKPQKDPITFARAAVVAGRSLRRARFWIAGDGPLRREAESVAREGGLGERFRVLGWRRDVPELLAAADILVLTSRFEGLPLAVLRGMAAELPVVATAVDGTPEAVEHDRSGLLVPPGDADAVARALIRLGASPGLRRRMGARGRELSARFDRSVAWATLAGVYANGSGRRGVASAPPRTRLEANE